MENQFDVIIIGSGVSGGWAAKEFTDKGYNTLMIERGRDVVHTKDYTTTHQQPWETKYNNRMTAQWKKENPILDKCYAVDQATEQHFVKDKEAPYIQSKPFDWIRSYQTGGKSLLWARQVQRWSDYDFEGPKRDDYSLDWPIRYKDLEKWYTHVEHFIGVSGNKDGLDSLPDGDFLKPMEMNRFERHFKETVNENHKDRHFIIARCAHLTEVRDIHMKQGRGTCQYRNLCYRGCPFGGYFSSNSSTIPWAKKTGNLTQLNNTIVKEIIYDDTLKKATGVLTRNIKTGEEKTINAKVIFVNAATVNSNQILLNSKSERFPNGLGNDSGVLGKYIVFHNYRARVVAEYSGFQDFTKYGRRPNSCYMPRFKNLKKHEEQFKRGYAVAFEASREVISETKDLVGQELKDAILKPKLGKWKIFALMMGETIPKENSTITLHPTEVDQNGMPLIQISMDYDDNDIAMMEDFYVEMSKMMEEAGAENIQRVDTHQAPGLDIHEMGGIRMGKDPKLSILNENNQIHACPNVFVTDGACMNTTSTQNPSLTFMALTARAVDFVDQNKGDFEL